MNILVIEDDNAIASFIERGLKEAGYKVTRAADGAMGLHMCLTENFDAAVIDIMLPKLNGLSLLGELRQKGKTTPVIILSAKRSVDDRIKGLQAGGDDYLTKPFSFSELLARIQALIRRNERVSEPTRLSFGNLTMDLLSREVTRGERRIDLQPREFSLLEYFLRNPSHVLSKTMIMERIWNYDFDPQTNVVDVLVCRLRNKVDTDRDKKFIQTIRGMGYVLRAS